MISAVSEMPPYHSIALLPEHIANKIAAGEVIQRPASVVKELLENSLDAGAARITLVVKDGGTSYIQVGDDGGGMEESDARLAFLRHATSKITAVEDLEEIRTYGFRGEALASIAAVARVAMVTRRMGNDTAVALKVEGGGPLTVSREAREPGTTITVLNLFYNVPARRKFLKSPQTEFRHIHEAVERIALSRPDAAIDFLSNGEKILHLSGESLAERVINLFGERQYASMIEVREANELLTIHGFIGKPSFGRKTRAQQFLFLNRRFILNRNIAHAVYSGYEHLLEKGAFPFFLLFLEIDPRRVDVNVHPSKLEAKFEEEQAVHRMVHAMVRKALAVGGHAPSVSVAGEGDLGALRFDRRQHDWPRKPHETDLPGGFQIVDTQTGEILGPGGARTAGTLLGPPAQTGPAVSTRGPEGQGEYQETGRIWQLHSKYILSQIKTGLLVVDQHVAHERILYERALKRLETGERASQQLLFPTTVAVQAVVYSLLEELLPHLTGIGFDIKLFGKNTIVVEGVPPDVRAGSEERVLAEMLELYREYQRESPMDARDNLAKSFACRAAVKAGDPLGEQEMRSLIDQLFATKMPYVCPHGRPVVLRIPLEELDRRFGRTS
jgi:DNA mismatch repair protein MutL